MRWLLPVLVLGCSHPKPAPVAYQPEKKSEPIAMPSPAPAPKLPPRLFSEDEIAAWQTRALAEFATNAKRTCPIPSGTQHGSAGPDVAAVFEGSGPLADCYARIGEAGKDNLKEALATKRADAVAIDTACTAKLDEAFHRAAAFDEGCSPFQIGVRPEPKALLAPIQIAHFIGFHMSVTKDPVAALGHALDALRAYQDLKRGHIVLIDAMLAIAASEIIAARADEILESAKVGKPQLDAIAKQLDGLIATEPSFYDIIVGEREAQDLNYGMSILGPKDWAPPGGWNDELRMRESPRKGKRFADPRDENFAVVLASHMSADAREGACPASATLEQCRVGLDAIAKQPPPPRVDTQRLFEQGQTDEPGMRASLRKQIVEILAAVAAPNFSGYVEKEIRTVSRLVELRAHVEALRTHACDAAAFAALAPASLGAPLALTIDKKVASMVVGKDTWTFHCR